MKFTKINNELAIKPLHDYYMWQSKHVDVRAVIYDRVEGVTELAGRWLVTVLDRRSTSAARPYLVFQDETLALLAAMELLEALRKCGDKSIGVVYDAVKSYSKKFGWKESHHKTVKSWYYTVEAEDVKNMAKP